MSFGFSRDDIGGFLHDYLEDNILEADPFQTIDQDGVGQLIQMAVEQGPLDPRRPEDRHLRRAGRRSGQRRVLLPERAELRQLPPVPRADRPAGRGPGGHQGEEVDPERFGIRDFGPQILDWNPKAPGGPDSSARNIICIIWGRVSFSRFMCAEQMFVSRRKLTRESRDGWLASGLHEFPPRIRSSSSVHESANAPADRRIASPAGRSPMTGVTVTSTSCPSGRPTGSSGTMVRPWALP